MAVRGRLELGLWSSGDKSCLLTLSTTLRAQDI